MADKTEEELNNIEKEEKKELIFILKEFYYMRGILKLIMIAEEFLNAGNNNKAHNCIKRAFRRMRKEGRIERRMARAYNHMTEEIKENWPFLSKNFPNEVKEIQHLLEQTLVYNNDLVKLNSRGGELIGLLKEAKKNPTKLNKIMEEIKRDIKDLQAFDGVMESLISKTEIIHTGYKKMKRSITSNRKRKSILDMLSEQKREVLLKYTRPFFEGREDEESFLNRLDYYKKQLFSEGLTKDELSRILVIIFNSKPKSTRIPKIKVEFDRDLSAVHCIIAQTTAMKKPEWINNINDRLAKIKNLPAPINEEKEIFEKLLENIDIDVLAFNLNLGLTKSSFAKPPHLDERICEFEPFIKKSLDAYRKRTFDKFFFKKFNEKSDFESSTKKIIIAFLRNIVEIQKIFGENFPPIDVRLSLMLDSGNNLGYKGSHMLIVFPHDPGFEDGYLFCHEATHLYANIDDSGIINNYIGLGHTLDYPNYYNELNESLTILISGIASERLNQRKINLRGETMKFFYPYLKNMYFDNVKKYHEFIDRLIRINLI
jgi:hypothetical protein